MQLDLQQE
jgi:hypothetical protein